MTHSILCTRGDRQSAVNKGSTGKSMLCIVFSLSLCNCLSWRVLC